MHAKLPGPFVISHGRSIGELSFAKGDVHGMDRLVGPLKEQIRYSFGSGAVLAKVFDSVVQMSFLCSVWLARKLQQQSQMNMCQRRIGDDIRRIAVVRIVGTF